MAHTFDNNVVSDLHKDAYGFRPSAAWWASWKGMDGDAKQAEWDRLCLLVEEEEQRRVQGESANLVRWHGHIDQLMRAGGISRARAVIRDMQDRDAVGDAGYYCFRWGISYHNEREIQDLLDGRAV